LFRLFGLHDGPHLSLAAMAALGGVTVEWLDQPLAELVATHLVSQVSADRYGCHDLLALYASELARTTPDAKQLSARRRLAGWYLHSACAARVALSPNLPPMDPEPVDLPGSPMSFAGAAEALDWFEVERANLMAAIRGAQAQGWHRIGWQLPTAMYGYFDLRKHYADWIASHEMALECARQVGDQEAQGRILCNIANAYRPLRRDGEAIDHYVQALALFREVGYRQGQAKVLGNLGLSYETEESFEEAFDAHQRSLEIFREIGDRFGEALTLTNLGELHQHLDRLPEAEQCHRLSLELFRSVGDDHEAYRATANLGVTLARMGDVATGIALATEALSGFHLAGDLYEEANTLGHLGDMHARVDHSEQARKCWREALRLYEQVGDTLSAQATSRKLE
jgi:tetratricopeptide (TPR) repeat protein